MPAALSITPASGAITARKSACRVNVTGADVVNTNGTQKRYRVRLTAPSGSESEAWSGYSHLFNVSADGKHEYNGYIFPGAGSWSVRLHDEEEDTDVATLAVTVA